MSSNSEIHSMTLRFRTDNKLDREAFEYLCAEAENRGMSKNSLIINVLLENSSKVCQSTDNSVVEIVDGVLNGLANSGSFVCENTPKKDGQESKFMESDFNFAI